MWYPGRSDVLGAISDVFLVYSFAGAVAVAVAVASVPLLPPHLLAVAASIDVTVTLPQLLSQHLQPRYDIMIISPVNNRGGPCRRRLPSPIAVAVVHVVADRCRHRGQALLASLP